MLTDCRGLIYSLLLSTAAVTLWASESGPAPPPLPEPSFDGPAAVATVGLPGSAGLPRATSITVIDGDTIAADITLPWNITLRSQRIRASGFDAWESNKRRRSVNVTDAEVLRGKAASAYLTALVQGCDLIVIPGEEPRDNYGRILGRWYLINSAGGLVPIANLMQSHGHIRH